MAKEDNNCGMAHNMIAAETIITGNIKSENDIRIDGTINGNVENQGKIILGTSGKIFGNIQCKNADIMGYIKGKLLVSDLLSLKSTARIEGDIKTKVLSIEPNALFSGVCEMNKVAESSEKK